MKIRKKKYFTKGEEFYKKNKKKYNNLFDIIQATKQDIDEYYQDEKVGIEELFESHYKLNSINYLKNNIALVLVIGLSTTYIGEIISNFCDGVLSKTENTEDVVSLLWAPLDDLFIMGVTIIFYVIY